MKTGNFPAKKNERRIRALARLVDKDSKEAHVLRQRITTYELARAIRTKKNRSGSIR